MHPYEVKVGVPSAVVRVQLGRSPAPAAVLHRAIHSTSAASDAKPVGWPRPRRRCQPVSPVAAQPSGDRVEWVPAAPTPAACQYPTAHQAAATVNSPKRAVVGFR